MPANAWKYLAGNLNHNNLMNINQNSSKQTLINELFNNK